MLRLNLDRKSRRGGSGLDRRKEEVSPEEWVSPPGPEVRLGVPLPVVVERDVGRGARPALRVLSPRPRKRVADRSLPPRLHLERRGASRPVNSRVPIPRARGWRRRPRRRPRPSSPIGPTVCLKDAARSLRAASVSFASLVCNWREGPRALSHVPPSTTALRSRASAPVRPAPASPPPREGTPVGAGSGPMGRR